ncbi:MAG: hypothetical protein ACI8ZB_001844 [Desulforhopalus sp.]|jgi:hypothetical protein
MQRRIIHQWRDWLLEYIGGDNYELLNKKTLEVFTIVAQDGMDAENKSQLIVQDAKKTQT